MHLTVQLYRFHRRMRAQVLGVIVRNWASESLEQRTRARYERDTP